MHKAFEYRLYPNREQHRLLLSCLAESRYIYNEMLESVKAHYEETGSFLTRYDLTYRFKSPKRWHSIQLRQYGLGRDVYLDPDTGRLRVPKKLGARLKLKQHRPLEGTPKTVHLVLRADGHWYVLIVCDLGDAPEKRDGPAVGIDVGLKVFATDSEGGTVENPRCLRRAAKRLRRAQQKSARRKKGSHRRRKAARAVAKQHLKVSRQRKDHAHKTAREYVDKYATLAVEDLRVCNMLNNHHLARAISDAGWSQFVNILELKAGEAGVRVYKVAPQLTSQICSNCGEVVEKSLSVRTHVCPWCGYVADRDHNAARNILAKAEARAEPSYSNAGGGPHGARSRLL